MCVHLPVGHSPGTGSELDYGRLMPAHVPL